ncbi:Sec-independent protein translocase protein TatB [Xylella fastidiosa]|uniref:Sec-independent protein translocase protein TatB n=1 Tax=Xylella fastidiosa TaxID=2371 RepID=UPI0009836B61|nr:Sec-independent protein translocase protein TatB [Xylella fastidiosa]ALR08271.2 twin arginine-targeting protein translocase TatB [Xylella fastidiosa]WGZ32438.1 Sec-independent protein translocase protein TatB [Xylella fastidiosa subsp. pauca]WGZ34769.1 Sec-independent protein translocase protein TatB [Xylella fastidiosa subsp. pauca]WGZ37045.1 Sec-independent protein translocase protein TatB [Xylella fastidiosa subsp. pauca]
MFDIGFSELLLIAVVALVVLGPERLPKAARFAGLLVRRARTQWESVKQELERELEAEALKRNLQHAQQALRDAQAQLQQNQQDMDIQNSISILHEQTKRDIHTDHDTNTREPGTVVHHTHVTSPPPSTSTHCNNGQEKSL